MPENRGSISGKIKAVGEAVEQVGNSPVRIWRPILEVEPGPDGRAKQNVSLLIGTWFRGLPIEESKVRVAGTWHDSKGSGRYLEVDEYTDTGTGPVSGVKFSKDAGKLTDVDLSGTVEEWRDLSMLGRYVAFTFTLVDDKTQTSNIVAFRGYSEGGVGWLTKDLTVRVKGGKEPGGVVVPREITFPHDPDMAPWTDRPGTTHTLSIVFTYVVLALMAVVPWVGFVVGPGSYDPFFDEMRQLMLPFLVAWSCLILAAAAGYTVWLLKFRTRRGRHPA